MAPSGEISASDAHPSRKSHFFGFGFADGLAGAHHPVDRISASGPNPSRKTRLFGFGFAMWPMDSSGVWRMHIKYDILAKRLVPRCGVLCSHVVAYACQVQEHSRDLNYDIIPYSVT